MSCASCHRQELGFTDGRSRAIGATGQPHPRSAMSLVNIAYNQAFNWSDPTVHSLEDQALKPMLSTNPVELGLNVIQADFLKLTRADPVYRSLFPQAFPGEANPHIIGNIAKALAAFERTIIGGASAYDRFRYEREGNAISESAKRGEILFFLDGGPSCFRCHGGFNFSDGVQFVSGRSPAEFHNTALYNLAGPFSYPLPNVGLFQYTKRPADIGKFKAPIYIFRASTKLTRLPRRSPPPKGATGMPLCTGRSRTRAIQDIGSGRWAYILSLVSYGRWPRRLAWISGRDGIPSRSSISVGRLAGGKVRRRSGARSKCSGPNGSCCSTIALVGRDVSCRRPSAGDRRNRLSHQEPAPGVGAVQQMANLHGRPSSADRRKRMLRAGGDRLPHAVKKGQHGAS